MVGAGAVGGVIGGRLFESGHNVVLVARGRHLNAIRSNGLTVASQGSSVTLQIPVVGHPAEADLQTGDIVIIATKSQDTAEVVRCTVCDGLRAADRRMCAERGAERGDGTSPVRGRLRHLRDGTHLSFGARVRRGGLLAGNGNPRHRAFSLRHGRKSRGHIAETCPRRRSCPSRGPTS